LLLFIEPQLHAFSYVSVNTRFSTVHWWMKCVYGSTGGMILSEEDQSTQN